MTTLTETLRYRGAIGQWSWVLHRISGLGVVLFLTLHVIDTSWAVFYPGLYEEAIAAYQSPLFTLGEFALIACVVYHAYNGLRIVVFDFNPRWWKHQQRAAHVVLGLTRDHPGAGLCAHDCGSPRSLQP
ncbi:MAG: succinate dehydrogenase, cytochrome b556 subunit [Chloroflexi bacterium]|nr:succinate dehydrogenase, cytochrome b556 subunit [Chloroflexota bacterium]